MEERNIEEIKMGVTPKLLVSILIGWTTLLISIIGSYYGIKMDFQEQGKTNTVFNLQISNLTNQIELQKTQIEKLSRDVTIQGSQITILQEEQKEKR